MTTQNYDSKEKVYEFLQANALAILSTVSPEGMPYAAPIYFIADKELNFFFLTKSDTKKAQNIEKNKQVAMTVVSSSQHITVQSSGNVEEVQEPEIYVQLAEANAKEKGGFSWPPPLSKLQSDGYLVMYKYKPEWLRVGDFSEPKEQPSIPKNIYHQIIPQKHSS